MSEREIWVFAEKGEALAELMAAGRQLGEKVVALVAGSKPDAVAAGPMGADSVLWLGQPSPADLLEDYVDTLLALLAGRRPYLLLVHATRRGKLIAGRLAAGLGTSVLNDVKQLTIEDGAVVATHLLYGGGAVRTEKSLSPITIATVGSGVFRAMPEDASRTAEIDEIPLKTPATKLRVVERRGKGARTVNLAAAKTVVGVGRGFGKREDLALAEQLARMLGAEIGCSRPLAEGVDWLPRERYIGVSGATVKPDLYLAIGISGQIQHMTGAGESRVVAAINRDKAAPIFAQADIGIVGDLYRLIPLLVAALKESRS